MFAGRELSHLDVLRLSMVHGLGDPVSEQHHSAGPSDEETDRADGLAHRLCGAVPNPAYGAVGSLGDRGSVSHETLSTWCDRALGTSIVSDINEQMIKWCGAFLDEGEASWAMPDRQQTFYRAWKRLARYDAGLRLSGVADAAQKIDALDDRPEEAVLHSLAGLGIPKSAWESYFALHLSAIAGLDRLYQVAIGGTASSLASPLSDRSGEIPGGSVVLRT